jgi:uncharacterized membrane protein YfcA
MRRCRLSTLMLLIVLAALGIALVEHYRRAGRRAVELQARLAEEDLWWRSLEGRIPIDGDLVGLVGGIAGGVVDVAGGIVGTYFSIRNTNGPKERAFAARAAGVCWLGASTFLVWLFLATGGRQWTLWAAYLPLLFWFVRWANEGLDQARVQDMAAEERQA